MSNDLVLEQSLAQMRGGDAAGALARLRRLAQGADDSATDATDNAPGRSGAGDRSRQLQSACDNCAVDDAAQLRQVLEAFEREYPDWDEPSFRLAGHLAASGDVEGAELAYGRCVEKNPTRPEVLLPLGKLLLARRALEPANKLLKLCCALAPHMDEAWSALGTCLLQQGNPTHARGAFIKAQRLAPARVDYALHRVEAAAAAGRLDEEHDRLDVESDADPTNAALLTARGEIATRMGRRDLAIDLFEAAVVLAPYEKLPIAKLAERLTHTMRPVEAERVLNRALELDPTNAKLGLYRSVALMRQTRHRDACVLLEKLIDQVGDDSALLGNLSTATLALGHQAEAVDQARRGLKLEPEHPAVWRTLCNNLPYYDGVTAAELSDVARETARRWPREAPPHLTNWRDADRRLRVGLLSSSMKVHPVGWLTIAGFEALDPRQFELVRLTAFVQDDYIARRFAAIAPEMHDTAVYDDAGLAHYIRSIGIDILIDLGGYGDLGRMPVCCYRAAPVQIKWVGMQNHTSGIAEMDWIVADRWEIPPELEQYYTEQPLRLADGYVCYSPPPDAPDVAPLPALANGHVTFGCFNNLSKLTAGTIAIWARLLRQMPTSRLWLKAPQFSEAQTADDLCARFAEHGIDRDRLTMSGASRQRSLLEEYAKIDIVLDPFPYNGGLTTCEALWMGVPTVTLPGEIFASRHSLSHLSNVGLQDWVARDWDDYIAIAVSRASDLAGLAALRAGLRDQVQRSPLCDAPRFGVNFGAALRHTWHQWCARA